MYDLQPAAAALHQGSLNAFSSITTLIFERSQRALDLCSATRQNIFAGLASSHGSSLTALGANTSQALQHHSETLTRESLETLLALHEEMIRFFEGHSHGLNTFIAHSIEKAGQATPLEMLPAVKLFRQTVGNLDSTLVHLAESAVHTAEQIEARISAPAIAANA